jgi:tripeptidyl-peptidase-1
VTERGSPSIVQSAGEFPGNWHQETSDLATFGQNVQGTALNLSKVAGFADPGGDVSGETTLDIQYIAGVGSRNTNWLWNSENWIYEMTQMLQNKSAAHELPSVMSMSYGWSEKQQCGGVTNADCRGIGVDNAEYVNRTNFELQKVGLLGITMLASSGDSGCHGRTDKVCLFNPDMHPDFPAGSPFITAVGGTNLDRNSPIDVSGATSPVCMTGGQFAGRCAMNGTEIVSSTGTGSRITSGGGFSNLTPRPAYQAAAVEAYLKKINLKSSIFNAAGRGYPDIAALAHNYYIEINGDYGSEDGTSASSPVVGGLVGLLNAHRALKGRPAVGFINPLLYQIHNETAGAAFNDITSGSNRCTEGGCECKTGFDATPGWDASTGLGTPNYGRLVEAMDAIDDRRERLIAGQQQ